MSDAKHSRDSLNNPEAETQPPMYIYLGANHLHVGLYANVINLMEEIGMEIDLVVNQLFDARHPFRMLAERKYLLDQIIQPSRSLIRGKIHGPILFHYRVKLPYILALLSIVSKFRWQGKRVVLHARTLHVADAALWVKRVFPSTRVIAELEGDGVSETLYTHNRNRHLSENALAKRLHIHPKATERVLSTSDAILCVSNKLRDVLVDRHGLTQEQQQRIRVFPTLVSSRRFYFDEEKRTVIRREWGLDGRYVVVYAGNLLSPWQLPQQTVELFKIIMQVKPEAILLIVSPEPEHRIIRPHLENTGIGREYYQFRSVIYNEIPSCLCGADLGVILREKHLMNEVASPGKIGEYLLSGLPIVMTESVGEFASNLRESDQALILENLNNFAAVEHAIRGFCSREITSARRFEFSQWAKERFSLESWVHVLESVYGG